MKHNKEKIYLDNSQKDLCIKYMKGTEDFNKWLKENACIIHDVIVSNGDIRIFYKLV